MADLVLMRALSDLTKWRSDELGCQIRIDTSSKHRLIVTVEGGATRVEEASILAQALHDCLRRQHEEQRRVESWLPTGFRPHA